MTATYYGTTAGSTLQNPPVVVAQAMMGVFGNAPGSQGGRFWFYQSTNFSSDIENGGTAVITDGKALGMKPGDLLFGVQTSSAGDVTPFTFITPIITVTTAGAFTSTNVISSTHA